MGIIGRLLGGGQDPVESRVREALAPLDLAQRGLAGRATGFVLHGTDPEVLLHLPQVAGSPTPAELLGRPGRLRWHYHVHGTSKPVAAAAQASLQARAALWTGLPAEHPGEATIEVLVRLGKALAATVAPGDVDDPGAGAPTWLQALVNDMVFGAHERIGHRQTPRVPGVHLHLVDALLAADDRPDPALVLRIGFERKGVDSYYQGHLAPLVSSPATAEYLRQHPAQVEELPAALSATGRVALVQRLGADPALARDFAPVLVRLSVDASKQARDAASTHLDLVPEQQRVGLLVHLLRDGTTSERTQAARLLARFPGEVALAPLQEAERTETSKPVLQAVREATAALVASTTADTALPEPPPYEPFTDEPLGEAGVEALRRNLADCVRDAEQEALREEERNRTSKHRYDWAARRLAELRKVGDGELRQVVAIIDGTSPASSVKVERLRRLVQVVEHRWRLQELPAFTAAHQVRWVAASRPGSAFWHDGGFQQWLLGRPEGSVDLRAVAALFPGEEGVVAVGRASLVRSWYGATPVDQLPADRVWPFFAEHPELVDQGLGLSADTLSEQHRWYSVDVGETLRVVATFPVLPSRWVPRLTELALGQGRTHRAAAQRALSALPDIGARVAESLSHGQSEVRVEAAAWLGRLGDPASVPVLRRALASEKRETVRAALLTALEALGDDISGDLSPATLVAEARKGLRAKVPAALTWFPFDRLPAARWADGTEVEPDVLRWWVVLSGKLKEPAGNALLTRYLGLLDAPSRAALGETVLRELVAQDTLHPSHDEAEAHAAVEGPRRHAQYQQYLQNARTGPQASRMSAEQLAFYESMYDKTLEQCVAAARAEKLGEYLGSAIAAKGVLALTAGAPGPVAVEVVRQYTRDHYQRRAQVEALLDGLSGSDDPAVIQLLLSISRRYRTRSVQERALAHVEAIAERRGWSQDQLADRTIPTAGLDESGTLELSYGPRSFAVTLDTALKPVLRSPDGKVLKALPAPRQDDDAEAAKEAKKELTAHKKEVKQVVDLQTSRLYEAMCTDRTWPAADWDEFLRAHPLAGRLVQRLVWLDLGPEGSDGFAHKAFRPADDGSLLDPDDDEVELPADHRVRLAHGSLLDADEREAWRTHLRDYRVASLFDQLGNLPPDVALRSERDEPVHAVDDHLGWVTDTFTIRGALTKRGYQRDQAEDGGWFYRYFKDFDSTGLRAVVEFTGSTLPEENIAAAVKVLVFEDTRSRSWNARSRPLEEVPRVLLAETYADYRAVAAAGAFDPQWEKVTAW